MPRLVFITSIESPAVLDLNDRLCLYYGFKKGKIILCYPDSGISKISLVDFLSNYPSSEPLRFALPRRNATSPTSRFSWSWFFPLLSKYRVALILVFIASLLSQLFGLSIPLLLQQIIDKVFLRVISAVLTFLNCHDIDGTISRYFASS